MNTDETVGVCLWCSQPLLDIDEVGDGTFECRACSRGNGMARYQREISEACELDRKRLAGGKP